MREQLADELAVVLVGHQAVDARVHAPDVVGLGRAEGRVGTLGGGVVGGRVQAEHRREPLPEKSAGRTGRRHGDQVDPARVQAAAPASQDVRHLLDAPEPRRQLAAACGVADLLEEGGVVERAPVLDVLLPFGRNLPDQVTRGEYDVHLGVTEGRDRTLGLPLRGDREDLVGHDAGAVELADPRGHLVPGSDRLALEPAPRQLHQVERGEEVCVEPVRRIENPLLCKGLPVLEEQVLDERGPCLRCADMHQDLAQACSSRVSSTDRTTTSTRWSRTSRLRSGRRSSGRDTSPSTG